MQTDQKNNVEALVAIANTAISGNGTTAGAIIDTKDFCSLTFLIIGGTLTDGVYTPVVNESDDSGMSGENLVADDFLIDTEADAALVAADDDTVQRLGYVGHKRFVTCDILASGVTTGGNVSVLALLGHPNEAPTAANA